MRVQAPSMCTRVSVIHNHRIQIGYLTAFGIFDLSFVGKVLILEGTNVQSALDMHLTTIMPRVCRHTIEKVLIIHHEFF